MKRSTSRPPQASSSERRLEDVEDKLVKARTQISQLQYEVNLLRTATCMLPEDVLHAAEVEVRCQRLEDELQLATVAATASRERAAHFEAQCADFAHQLEKVGHRLRAAESAAAAAAANPASPAEIARAANIAELTAAHERLRRELESQSHARATAESRLIEAQSKATSLQDELLSARKRADDAVDEAAAARRTWREGHRLLERTREEHEATVTELKVASDKLREETAAAIALRSSEASLREQVLSLRAQNDALRAESNETRRIRLDSDRLTSENAALRDQAAADKKVIAELNVEVRQAVDRIRLLETANNGLQAEVQRSTDSAAAARLQLETLERELGRQLRHHKAAHEALEKERGELRASLDDERRRVATLTLIANQQHSLQVETLKMADAVGRYSSSSATTSAAKRTA